MKLSRSARGELKCEQLDLSALAQEILTQLQSRQPERQIVLSVKPGLVVRADPGLMRSALENLLGNAWKYTGKRADATIELGCLDQDGRPTYFVRDNGAGFDMHFAEKLFVPCERLHHRDQFPGTGVGLTTVQRIILKNAVEPPRRQERPGFSRKSTENGDHLLGEAVFFQNLAFFLASSASWRFQSPFLGSSGVTVARSGVRASPTGGPPSGSGSGVKWRLVRREHEQSLSPLSCRHGSPVQDRSPTTDKMMLADSYLRLVVVGLGCYQPIWSVRIPSIDVCCGAQRAVAPVGASLPANRHAPQIFSRPRATPTACS